MNVEYRTVPDGTKVYRIFKNCAKHQGILPAYVKPVFKASSRGQTPLLSAGFANLPDKLDGKFIIWFDA